MTGTTRIPGINWIGYEIILQLDWFVLGYVLFHNSNAIVILTVFVFLILHPCSRLKEVSLRNTTSWSGASNRIPSPSPSTRRAPKFVPAPITKSSLPWKIKCQLWSEQLHPKKILWSRCTCEFLLGTLNGERLGSPRSSPKDTQKACKEVDNQLTIAKVNVDD